MKIAYVLGTSAGGTGAHVALLARECAARGMTVTVHGPADTGRRFFAPQAGAVPGGPPAVVPQAGAVPGGPPAFVPVEIADRPRPARDLVAVVRLRGLLRRGAPDVVHAHGLRAGAVAALALSGWKGWPRRPAGRARRRPALVVTVHNAPPRGGPAGAVFLLLEWIVARRADAVTWVSGDLGERMRRRGARDGGRALVAVAPPAPPTGVQVARAREDLSEPGRPSVLAVGRLSPQKGFGVLLEAAARWRDQDPRPVLAIAGEGPLAAALTRQADAAGLAVRFLGRRDDIPALLAAADVIAVPSMWEGQPLIVAEALGAGRPLVAARTGGIPDLTGQDGALLVRPGDAAALSAAVLSVLSDPALAVRLAAAASRRAAALPTASEAAAAAAGLYRRVAAAATAGAGCSARGGR